MCSAVKETKTSNFPPVRSLFASPRHSQDIIHKLCSKQTWFACFLQTHWKTLVRNSRKYLLNSAWAERENILITANCSITTKQWCSTVHTISAWPAWAKGPHTPQGKLQKFQEKLVMMILTRTHLLLERQDTAYPSWQIAVKSRKDWHPAAPQIQQTMRSLQTWTAHNPERGPAKESNNFRPLETPEMKYRERDLGRCHSGRFWVCSMQLWNKKESDAKKKGSDVERCDWMLWPLHVYLDGLR